MNTLPMLVDELIAKAEADRAAQVARAQNAGVSPLLIDALLDCARKEMWAVLFSHLVEVARHTAKEPAPEPAHEGAAPLGYADGVRYGVHTCVENVFNYAHRGTAGDA